LDRPFVNVRFHLASKVGFTRHILTAFGPAGLSAAFGIFLPLRRAVAENGLVSRCRTGAVAKISVLVRSGCPAPVGRMMKISVGDIFIRRALSHSSDKSFACAADLPRAPYGPAERLPISSIQAGERAVRNRFRVSGYEDQ